MAVFHEACTLVLGTDSSPGCKEVRHHTKRDAGCEIDLASYMR